MTGASMLVEFRLGFDVIASNAAPGFTDSEIYSLLNRGQDYIILDLYKQKNWELLQSLIKEDGATPTLEGTSVYSIHILSDYWLYISSYSVISRSAMPSTGFIPPMTTSYKKFNNDLIAIEDKENYISTPFNLNRVFKNPKFFILGNTCYVILDDYTTAISILNLRYVRKRLDISNSQACELQESLHRLVVDKAIDIAKTIINIQDLQSTKQS